jgi:hypothetical protein
MTSTSTTGSIQLAGQWQHFTEFRKQILSSRRILHRDLKSLNVLLKARRIGSGCVRNADPALVPKVDDPHCERALVLYSTEQLLAIARKQESPAFSMPIGSKSLTGTELT